MPIVEKHIIDINNWLDQELNQLCFLSKNLFNYSNYLTCQKFLFEGEYLDDYQDKVQSSSEDTWRSRSTMLIKNFKQFSIL
ncbi:MAG TPA: hypothetical protein V6D48_11355 [Oculatellaceae cyanobacterium]